MLRATASTSPCSTDTLSPNSLTSTSAPRWPFRSFPVLDQFLFLSTAAASSSSTVPRRDETCSAVRRRAELLSQLRGVAVSRCTDCWAAICFSCTCPSCTRSVVRASPACFSRSPLRPASGVRSVTRSSRCCCSDSPADASQAASIPRLSRPYWSRKFCSSFSSTGTSRRSELCLSLFMRQPRVVSTLCVLS